TSSYRSYQNNKTLYQIITKDIRRKNQIKHIVFESKKAQN
ncbi:MAG: hypothetical protein ACI90V_012561, partial [Bacillariaceae sp.]